MNEEQETTLNAPRSPFLRLAKWFGVGIGSLLILLCILLATGLFWLRTESGETCLREFVLASLKETGITVSFSAFEGPLPETLHVAGLTLADTQGIWFSLQEGTIRLHLPDLIWGQLTIKEVELIAPELMRLPESRTPPAPESKLNPIDILKTDRLKALGDNIRTILGHVTLEKVHIDNLKIGTELAGSPVVMNLAGGGPLTNLHTCFSMGTPLFSSIFPGYFATTSSGRGVVSTGQAESVSVPVLTGTLTLGNEGNWLPSPDASGHLPDVAVLLEANFPDSTPDSALSIEPASKEMVHSNEQLQVTEPTELHLLLSLNDAKLAIDTLKLTLPGGEISSNHLMLQEKKIEGTITATSTSPFLLYNLFSAPPAAATTEEQAFPLAKALLQGTLSGTPDSPLLRLQLHLDGMPVSRPETQEPSRLLSLTANLGLAVQNVFEAPIFKASGEIELDSEHMPPVVATGTAQAAPLPANNTGFASGGNPAPIRKEDDTTRLAILLENLEFVWTPEALDMQELRLASDILNMNAHARLFGTGQIESEASLVLPDLRRLLTCAAPLLPSALSDGHLKDLSGALELHLKAERKTEKAPLNGSFNLSLNSMHWGIPQVQSLLGAAPSLTSGFSVQPEEKGQKITVQNLLLASTGMKGNGRLDLTPDEHVKASLLLELRSLAELDSGLSGSAAIRAELAGPLKGPSIKLEAASPNLGLGDAELKEFQLTFAATSLGANGGRGHVQATGRMEGAALASLREDRTLRLGSDWELSPKTLTLENTALTLPGVSLDGKLQTTLTAAPQISGKVALDIKNWTVLTALTQIPLRGDPARIRLQAFPSGKQHVEMNWNFGTIATEGVLLRSLKGKASIDDPFGEQRVTAKADLGAGFITSGGLGWRKGELSLDGDCRALSIKAALTGRTTVDLKAMLRPAERNLEIASLNLQHKKNRSTSAGITLERPSRIDFSHGLAVDNLSLTVLPAGTITVNGHLGTGTLSLDGAIQNLSLKLLESFAASSTPEGTLNGRLSLKGTSSNPQGNLEFTLTDLGYPDNDLAPVSIRLIGYLRASNLELELDMDGLGTSPATGYLRLPVHFTPAGIPQPTMNRSMAGEFHWSGDLAALWQFVPLANTALLGHGAMDTTISGTLATPQITASIRLLKASFENILAGLLIADINADAELRSHGASTLVFSAGDGRGGTLTLEGTAGTATDGLPLSLTGTIHNLAPLHRNDLDINLSGDISVKGKAAAPDICADLTINKGQFRILESFGTSIPTLDVVDAGQPLLSTTPDNTGPNLDVTVTIPNQFFVRGAGIDSEWRGNLNVSGTAANPVITGILASVRGTFALLGKQFTLSKGQVSFSGGTPPNPLLDIQVAYQAPNITALATVGGTASSPVLTFSSQPALPQDEVVSQILFGQSANNLGRMEAIQLATELASLAGFGRGKGGVMGELRDSLGVDVLRFGSMQEGSQHRRPTSRAGLLQPGQNGTKGDAESIPALEVGKYITDDIYVGLEQGMNGDATGVRVEIELTPRLNLQGSTTPQGSEVGINWKKDY